MSFVRELTSRAFEPAAAAIAARSIPGAVLGVVHADGARHVEHGGWSQVRPHPEALGRETWFDLASLTKVIFTTTQILEAAADGDLDLDAPITTLLPDFRQYDAECWERQVTFRQCLGHQTPFPAVAPLYTYGQDPETLRAFILQREWVRGPAVYSDINFILLGLALERLRGRPVGSMQAGWGFSFSPPPDRCAATEFCTWRSQVMRGKVHDENAFALGSAGHAGLFGHIDSILDFAHDLLAGQKVDRRSVALIKTAISDTRTHGWERSHPGWSGGRACSENSIGHTGFTGTGLWIDFEQGLAWSLLTNRVHPSRHIETGIAKLRTDVGDIVGAAKGDLE